MKARPRLGLPLVLLGLYLAAFIIAGVAPLYRADWALESIAPVIGVAALVATFRNLRFSDFAYTALFVFLLFHTLGSHYTYAEVPIGSAVSDWFGWERNHYDRWVHFLYGFLLAPMAVELFDAKAPPRGVWVFLMPTLFLASHSMIYEILEWWAAELFGGDLGVAYLGIQGDAWDAQKDMALGAVGAAVGVGLYLRWRNANWGRMIEAIRAVRAAYNQAIVERDAGAIVGHLTDDYRLHASNGSELSGRPALLQHWQRRFASDAQAMYKRSPREIMISPQGTSAVETGNWTGRWHGPDGVVEGAGHYTADWQLQSDGHWRLVSERFEAGANC